MSAAIGPGSPIVFHGRDWPAESRRQLTVGALYFVDDVVDLGTPCVVCSRPDFYRLRDVPRIVPGSLWSACGFSPLGEPDAVAQKRAAQRDAILKLREEASR